MTPKHNSAVAAFNGAVSQGAMPGRTTESRAADWPVPCDLTPLAEAELSRTEGE